ncbi:monofunctional biosynthetic peptidoglycan transglycosylase [Leptobacterium flavescens]|uniref:Biosynthetic peptidoglycan transglycosylase n=1 Tax=Leptobacterium flavescens TaxID=472055 RepID=A0A6P0UP86_9FLAO|nr:monofunctional biosynthetic peptidoglycan transglycosylase [Leptobacterium flavescens]NER14260.1 monofunctional biosynthetic peptidoglycan transglycosylase [Leptobacterium flavescens]
MIKRIIRILVKGVIGFILFSVLLVLIFKWVPVPFTPLMVIRAIEQKKQGKEMSWKHDWVSIERISKNFQLAVVCSEDQKFLEHRGFDVKAIEKAYSDHKKGKRLRGASTISQQTAKNVFLWPQRSWLRKGLETYFTFLIELMWSKERILEVYLNSVEMGKGIYGAEAGARYWFQKPAGHLTAYEAASIAAILPNPRTYKANPRTPYLEGRKKWIMEQMNYFGPFKLK